MKEFFGIPPSAEFFCFKDSQANIIDVQANIVAILDNTGAVVVKYKYLRNSISVGQILLDGLFAAASRWIIDKIFNT